MTETLRTRRRRPTRVLAVATAGVLLGGVLPTLASQASAASRAQAAPRTCGQRVNSDYRSLLECVTVEGVREHQAAFQEIADNNDDEFYPGTRAAGTQGYADSVEYVAGLLDDAGYEVTLDPVPFQFDFPTLVQQLTPVQATFESDVMTGSGSGDYQGPVIPVDINLTPPRASTSGCEASDFAGLNFSGPNDIALIQRGTCSFAQKALNAEAAGAEAVIIFNQGNTPDREGVVLGTLEPSEVPEDFPVVGTTFAAGVSLSQPGSTARVRVIPSETRTDYNVIAEKPGMNEDNVVMAGAHLDSVTAGPGIQDNGSGSAALLETALLMFRVRPENTLRFAWWAAEENGLIGSTDYVNGLSIAERERIALYMNYDMVGSPNYYFGVYDADQSSYPAPVPVPPGSTAIEDVYESYYTWVGEPYDDASFSGRSDYQAFILNGIPSGGLFTGAEQIKTEEQEAIWGGVAGEQFDQCYHEACDTYDNVDLHALEVNSDLIAFAMLTFAYSTESVNGVPGESVPGRGVNLPAPAGPEGTFPDGPPTGGRGPGPTDS